MLRYNIFTDSVPACAAVGFLAFIKVNELSCTEIG